MNANLEQLAAEMEQKEQQREAVAQLEVDSCTDVSNALRFAKLHKKYLLFVEGIGWHFFDEKRWLYDPRRADSFAQLIGCEIRTEANDFISTASIHELTKSERDAAHRKAEDLMRWAKASESSMRIEAALKRSVCHMFESAASMDADSWLLNCTNGTLNLKTGILQPARPEDLITKMASVDYDPQAPCALWEQTLLSVCCDDLELVRYMQRVFGYALTGQTTEQVMFIFNGSGSNGKDTILNRIKKIMGSYAGLAAPSLLMVSRGDRHPTEQADLFSIRLAIASESNENGKLNETLIKQLTGSEKLKARKMHKDFFEFPALFKLVLMTNHRPIIEGSDYAIWRRIHLVPFNAVYKKGVNRDDTLPAKLDQELPGILRWCVEGCLEWQRIGLQPPGIVQQATQQYKADQDVLAQFFDEKCVLKTQAQVTAKAFYSSYEQWCSENGERAKSQTWLWPKLQERGIEKDKTRMGMNYRGIGLLNKDEV